MCAALNSNTWRYIANRPCPDISGQDHEQLSRTVALMVGETMFLAALKLGGVALLRTMG